MTPGIHFLNNRNVVVYCAPDGTLRATLNRCRHEGGGFRPTHTCVLTCPHHGWQLNLSTMEYINPIGALKQAELDIDYSDTEKVSFFSTITPLPWDVSPMVKQKLQDAELMVRYFAHACCEIRFAGRSLFTDPWLTGPAFSRGWWLDPLPPRGWLDRLSDADWIYISHNHSDHLNEHTLRLLASRRPDIPVFVPDFDNDSCITLAQQYGMTNIYRVPFSTWVSLDTDARLMILPDGTGRDDSGVLFEYKGHTILNAVDCSDINGGIVLQDYEHQMTRWTYRDSGQQCGCAV